MPEGELNTISELNFINREMKTNPHTEFREFFRIQPPSNFVIGKILESVGNKSFKNAISVAQGVTLNEFQNHTSSELGSRPLNPPTETVAAEIPPPVAEAAQLPQDEYSLEQWKRDLTLLIIRNALSRDAQGTRSQAEIASELGVDELVAGLTLNEVNIHPRIAETALALSEIIKKKYQGYRVLLHLAVRFMVGQKYVKQWVQWEKQIWIGV